MVRTRNRIGKKLQNKYVCRAWTREEGCTVLYKYFPTARRSSDRDRRSWRSLCDKCQPSGYEAAVWESLICAYARSPVSGCRDSSRLCAVFLDSKTKRE